MSETLSVITIEDQIREDHANIKHCYDQFCSTKDSKWYNQFVWELARHSVAEELVLYPIFDKFGLDGKTIADENRNEHHAVKVQLKDLEKTEVNSPDFQFKFDKLMEDLSAHIKKEEESDLNMISDNLSINERNMYAKSYNLRKKIVPTRPHVMVPESPVLLEEAMGLLLAPLDKFRDLFRSFPE